jgi:hypothetical protein
MDEHLKAAIRAAMAANPIVDDLSLFAGLEDYDDLAERDPDDPNRVNIYLPEELVLPLQTFAKAFGVYLAWDRLRQRAIRRRERCGVYRNSRYPWRKRRWNREPIWRSFRR